MVCSQKEECNPTGTENYFISKQYIVYIETVSDKKYDKEQSQLKGMKSK